MAVRTAGKARPLSRYAALSLCAILMAGCATTGGAKSADAGAAKAKSPKIEKSEKVEKNKQYYKDSIETFANPEADPSTLDPIAAAAYWGTRYEREPQSAEAAARYSAALRKIGSAKEALTVMTKAVERHPDDAEVNLEAGKAFVEDGRSFEAVRYFERAIEERKNDWRALSAYGVALDQIGEYEEAQKKYDAALLISPQSVSVMSNKGMSYALSGDLDQAATILRAAAAHRRSDARIRQNLALVLAMKGDLAEAERLARSDLPPQVAERNIQFFRQLMSQPAHWQDFASENVDAPNFDAPTSSPQSAPLPKLEEKQKLDEELDGGKPMVLAPAMPATRASAPPELKDR